MSPSYLAVVDPGVGSSRAVAAFRYHGQYVVCPDNGLITLVHRTWPVEAARRLSTVFGLTSIMPVRFAGNTLEELEDVLIEVVADHEAASFAVRCHRPRLAHPKRGAGRQGYASRSGGRAF